MTGLIFQFDSCSPEKASDKISLKKSRQNLCSGFDHYCRVGQPRLDFNWNSGWRFVGCETGEREGESG